MQLLGNIRQQIFSRHSLVLTLLLLAGVGAFATLGDGKKKRSTASRNLLSSRTNTFNGTFSLRSGYTFKGNTILADQESRVIRLNTDVALQVGKNTLLLPLGNKGLLNKVHIELGNRSLRNR